VYCPASNPGADSAEKLFLYASSSFKSHIILMGWGEGGKSPAAKL